MNKIKRLIVGLGFASVISTPVFAEKHLIFVDGYLGWKYSMPTYLKENHKEIEKLPFSGFSVVGNVYTSYAMSADPNSNKVSYERVWGEVGLLKDVYQKKTDNFLRINLDFPGDFWDDTVWERTTKNFANVAKAAKNIGFKGILFDDEVYASGQHLQAHLMSNFKFPKQAKVTANPENYQDWEIKESKVNRGDWVDYSCYIDGKKESNSENCGYRNLNYTFKEHMDKVASRFEAIMQAMQTEFPEITVLVLHGPATAHPKTNVQNHFIKPNSIFETNEYKGAMFLGFKQGLNDRASLHDMGEFYQYKTDDEFQNAYQWRKFDLVSEQYNQNLDDSYQWLVPYNQRDSWNDDVSIGFMVSDYGRPHTVNGNYNTEGLCQPSDVESRLTKALDRSDNYVIFYSDSNLSVCENDIRWADVTTPVTSSWLNMVSRVYNSIDTPLTVSSINTQDITKNSAMIFWDVSDFSTGQVEYGEDTTYGNLNTKETSFNYNHHEQLLRNLKPDTTYHYRVISIDAQGNKVVSKDQTFRTQADVVTLTSKKSVRGFVKKGSVKHYKIHAKAGQKVKARINKLSADADLRIQIGSKAGIHSFECKSIKGGRKPDSCSVTLTQDADVYIGVFGYRAASYKLKANVK